MNRHLPKIAAVLLIVAAGMVIVAKLRTHPAHPSGNLAAAVPILPRTDASRLSLEEALPPGAVIIREAGTDKIRVELPDGSQITAAGVSVTDSGVSFKSPYRLERPAMLPMSCSDGETNLVVSTDGKTFKSVGRAEWKGEFGIDFDY
ncbi:MAG: hypothetical protein EOP88_00100 [Verrucomicrobiaceae bacterium]|nr:MAG: hypothetical protein EOP88_00100 [Verrucomicrobiaceae bacterium]